jgi:hypothetical protein
MKFTFAGAFPDGIGADSVFWCLYHLLGGIKYNQIHHHLIDWFEKIHPFLNMLVIHLTPFEAHWHKKIFLEKWLVSNGGFSIFDTPYCASLGWV